MFRDQVGVLASWFKGWNECEQTVALLSLLKRVSPTQARFLQLCLEHSLAECTELQVLEGEANNPGRTTTCLVRCIYRHSQTLRLLFCSSHCTLLLQQLHSSYHKGVNCEIGKKNLTQSRFLCFSIYSGIFLKSGSCQQLLQKRKEWCIFSTYRAGIHWCSSYHSHCDSLAVSGQVFHLFKTKCVFSIVPL